MQKLRYFFTKGYYTSNWSFGMLFLFILFFTNFRQNVVSNFNCEICSDKAGYYMFLPAVFELGFEADQYPKNFDTEHGGGFFLDHEQNKVISKFTCGIAVLQAPFYGLGSLISKVFGINADGYAHFYMLFINLGASFYMVLGLYFLRKWLNYYVDKRSSFLSILLIYFGTNLIYYSMDENLMSHLYSFSAFAVVLYSLKSYFETNQQRYFLLFTVAISFAILIRPTNGLFAVFAFLMDVDQLEVIGHRLKALFTLKNIVRSILVFSIIVSPQLIYWEFAYGGYIYWSYEGEGFSLWNSPAFLTVWFSPQSGYFTYTPLGMLALVSTFILFKNHRWNAVMVFITFLAISYMCASWHNPYFGLCNFGKRPMIEYYPIIMFPLAYVIQNFSAYTKPYRILTGSFIFLFTYFNLTVFGVFDTCFFGDFWDWEEYGALVWKGMRLIR